VLGALLAERQASGKHRDEQRAALMTPFRGLGGVFVLFERVTHIVFLGWVMVTAALRPAARQADKSLGSFLKKRTRTRLRVPRLAGTGAGFGIRR
jgi:hypothetical protein